MIIGTNNIAKEFKVSRETIYNYCKEGMPYIKISERKRGYDIEVCKKWLIEKGAGVNERLD